MWSAEPDRNRVAARKRRSPLIQSLVIPDFRFGLFLREPIACVDYANGKPIAEIPGVSYRKDGGFAHNPEGGFITRSSNPWPRPRSFTETSKKCFRPTARRVYSETKRQSKEHG